MRIFFFVTGIAVFFLLDGCYPVKKTTTAETPASISSLRFVGEYDLPNGIRFKNTTIGGLSSIDYDRDKDVYYMVSDDPSAQGPARYYTAKIFLTEKGIDSVRVLDMVPLRDAGGKHYPDIRKDRIHSLDAEAMRYNPRLGQLVYSSEGQRFKSADGLLQMQDPVIVAANLDGTVKDSFALPANVRMHATENGLRHNSVFEGLTFSNDYLFMYISVEEPIYEDGPRAATGDSTAWIRILKFDTRTRRQVAQYAYRVEPVPYPAVPPDAFKINGVSDILYIGNEKLIVTERAYMTGRAGTYIRLFIADVSGAADVSSVQSLLADPPVAPVSKKLLLNMEDLGKPVENIEGATFGPVLPNGHKSLILVADNNFADNQKSQFWLFEILP